MHFHANFKKIQKGSRFTIKNVKIKNIYNAVKLPRNPRNPLQDF